MFGLILMLALVGLMCRLCLALESGFQVVSEMRQTATETARCRNLSCGTSSGTDQESPTKF